MLGWLAALLAHGLYAPALSNVPPQGPERVSWSTREQDLVLKDFRFRDGEFLPALRMHVTTLGAPHRDARGDIDNAIMILHGTGGSGKQFLAPQFAGELFGPGQTLDIRRYWVILPDNIGHGSSSKPSDGLRMHFPKYDYDDMVEAQYQLLTKGLGIRHLRLIMGTSMGCMHSFIWGETHPDFARALMPLACEPVEIAGLNRMWRELAIEGIEADPQWHAGDYRSEPLAGLRTAESLLFVAGAAPLFYQAHYPTRASASAYAQQRVGEGIGTLDANDLVYQLDASRTYDPSQALDRIKAPLTWINSADDFINPRNLTFPQQALRRMPTARFRLIPESADTHGHGTHTWARFWKRDLEDLLQRSQ